MKAPASGLAAVFGMFAVSLCFNAALASDAPL
jgi:hypothetical protein